MGQVCKYESHSIGVETTSVDMGQTQKVSARIIKMSNVNNDFSPKNVRAMYTAQKCRWVVGRIRGFCLGQVMPF